MANPRGHNGFKQRSQAQRSFFNLLNENNISFREAGMILGISQPVLERWKDGHFPKVSTLTEANRQIVNLIQTKQAQ